MKTYYKILSNKREARHGGSGKWEYRKWMPHISDIEACRRGYHVCREQDLTHWLNEAIWEVEIKGNIIEQSDKVVASDARLVRKLKTWNERTARLFACDCAERALRFADANQVGGLENTISVARRFADGKATDSELSAAWDAAWAAWAARDAARAARDAAWDAREAAWAAAWDARDARDAELKWQTKRLMQYLKGERP